MPIDLLMMLRTSEGYQPKCHLCTLAETNHEAAVWLSQQMVHATMSQTRMAQHLGEQFGVKADQSQISVHLVHHVMPELRRQLRELTTMQELEGLEPVAVLEQVAERVIAEVDARFTDGVGDRDAAGLHKVQLEAAERLAKLRSGEISVEEASLRVERMQRDAELAAESDQDRLLALLANLPAGLQQQVAAALQAAVHVDAGEEGGA
jgi:hypothetical protein